MMTDTAKTEVKITNVLFPEVPKAQAKMARDEMVREVCRALNELAYSEEVPS